MGCTLIKEAMCAKVSSNVAPNSKFWQNMMIWRARVTVFDRTRAIMLFRVVWHPAISTRRVTFG